MGWTELTPTAHHAGWMMCGQENTISLYLCDSHTSWNWKEKKKKHWRRMDNLCLLYILHSWSVFLNLFFNLLISQNWWIFSGKIKISKFLSNIFVKFHFNENSLLKKSLHLTQEWIIPPKPLELLKYGSNNVIMWSHLALYKCSTTYIFWGWQLHSYKFKWATLRNKVFSMKFPKNELSS